MGVNNPAKFAGLLVGMVCVTVLMVLHTVTSGEGLPIIAGAMLYLTGNGVAAKRGQAAGPALGAKGTVHVLADKATGDVISTDPIVEPETS